MPELRLLGGILAVVSLGIFLWTYWRRGGKWPVTLGVLFSGSLLLLTLYPNVLDTVIQFFTDTHRQYARLVFLLVLSVIVVTVMLIRTIFVTDFHERALRDLVFHWGLEQFEDDYRSEDIRSIQVVLPAFNEADNLARILPEVPDRLFGREVGVLVVSDGSHDATAEVAREHTGIAVENVVHLGQGTALRLGLEICRRHGADVVVTMDADGQHDPREIADLVEPVLREGVDLAVGSRQLGDSRPGSFLRRVGVLLFNVLCSVLLRRRITDCSSGFRAFRIDVVEHVELMEPQYFEPAFLIQTLAKDFAYREVPVTMLSRLQGSSKMPGDVRYGWEFLSVILRTWWRS